MLKRAKRASHIDPPASSYAIMRRASPYRGENPGPGEDVEGELEPRPGIREQPGSFASIVLRTRVRLSPYSDMSGGCQIRRDVPQADIRGGRRHRGSSVSPRGRPS